LASEIDVLLPFHRSDSYFDDALQSLVSSNGVKLRIVLIDDTPQQNFTPKISLSNNFKIEIVRTGGGCGYGQALKLGSEIIESSAVGLFNSDDLVHPDRFKRQLVALERSDLSITGMQRISARGHRFSSLSGEIHSKRYDPLYLLLGSYGANATWLMHSSWWKNNSFFDDEECLDWRIGLKTFLKTNIDWNPEKLYLYRRHARQVTSIKKMPEEGLNSVFLEWENVAKENGLANSSRNIFDMVAVPWLKKKFTDTNEIKDWSLQLLENARGKGPDIYENTLELVRRRYLRLALATSGNALARFRLIRDGKEEISPLLRDLVLSLRH